MLIVICVSGNFSDYFACFKDSMCTNNYEYEFKNEIDEKQSNIDNLLQIVWDAQVIERLIIL